MRAWAPGRVNLIGEHTDYNGGLALPVALQLGTSVLYRPDGSPSLRVRTGLDPRPATIEVGPRPATSDLDGVEPPWATLPTALVRDLLPIRGGTVQIESDLPSNAGLSSSAALCVALSLALAWPEGPVADPTADPLAIAERCRRAEGVAGAQVGLMDPLVSLVGRSGSAILIDFSATSWAAVPLPPNAQLAIVHSGQERRLAESRYAVRRAECAAAAQTLGTTLGQANSSDLAAIADPLQRRRARHVVTECERVRAMVEALAGSDLVRAGAILRESHRSQSADFDCSTPVVDALVQRLEATDGVYGARMTGGGFGGCVVALCERDAIDVEQWPGRAWRVSASGGAQVGRWPPPARD